MEQWLNLMFSNTIGLLSMITILGAASIVGFIAIMLAKKSAQTRRPRPRTASATRARSIIT